MSINWGSSAGPSTSSSFNFSGGQQSSSAIGGQGQPFGTPQSQQQQQQQQHGAMNSPFNNNLGGTGAWNSGGSQPSSSSAFGGFTSQPGQPQPQQHLQNQPLGGGFGTPHQQQQLGGYGGSNQQQAGGYGGGNAMYSSQPGFGFGGGSSMSGGQQPFPQQQQQQQQSYGQGQYQQNMMGNSFGMAMNSSTGYGPGGASNAGSSGSQQQNAVPRYMTGYLTGGTFSQSSPRHTSSNPIASPGPAGEGRMSPEQHQRELQSSSRGYLGNSTSSAGTGGGRESPSRSPRTSLFGSNRNLGAVARRGNAAMATSSSAVDRSDYYYMDEDAPPTDSLAEFDEDAPHDYLHQPSTSSSNNQQQQSSRVASPPSSSQQLVSRRPQGLENGEPSSSRQQQQQQQLYKITIFGFQPSALQTVLSVFESFDRIIYNSSTSSTSSSGSTGDSAPNGANWVTIAYDNEVAAMRALRKNGEVIRGNIMIGVKWADGFAPPSSTYLTNGSSSDETSASSLPRSNTASNLGQPIRVHTASSAYLNPIQAKQQQASKGSSGSIVGKLNEYGKPDAKLFTEQAQQQNSQGGGGVWGTVSNLIFGF